MKCNPYYAIILAAFTICLVSIGYMVEDCQGAEEPEGQGTFGNGMNWTYTNGTLTISGDNGIPDYGYYDSVPWRAYKNSITKVILSNGVTSIGSYAFYDHSNLKEIDIPSTITSIKSYSFKDCDSLTGITIPSNTSSISSDAFDGCSSINSIYYNSSRCGDFTANNTPFSSIGASSGVDVIFGGNVTKIPAFIFYSNTKIASISIPDSVNSYGDSCFYGCTRLKTLDISASTTTIGNAAFEGCTSINRIEYNATGLADYKESSSPFSNLKSNSSIALIIGSSVKKIPNFLFSGNEKITSISFPSTLQTLGEGCFKNCTGITTLTIPSGLTTISYSSFAGCSKISIINYNARSLTTNSNISPFSQTNASAKVTIGSGITSIPNNLFKDCTNFTFDTIPTSITSIGSYSFSNIKNTIDFSKATGIKTLGDHCFYKTNINWTLPNTITTIPEGAFSETTGSLIVPVDNKISSIGDSAFEKSSALSSITINNTTSFIGSNAFYGCSSLKTIDYRTDQISSIEDSSVFNVAASAKTEISFNSTIIPAYVLYNISTIYKAIISSNVQTIGDYAFYGYNTNYNCISFEVESNGINNIGNHAFENTNIRNVYIGPNSELIGIEAFYNCPISHVYYNNGSFTNSLTPSIRSSLDSGFTLHIGDEVISIPDRLLENTNVSAVILNNVKTIGVKSFSNTSLEEITIPISVEIIKEEAFSYIASLTKITFDNYYTEIESNAFYIEGSDIDTHITCFRKAIQNDYKWYNDNRDTHFTYIHLDGEYDGMMEVIFNAISPILGKDTTNAIIDFFIDAYSLKAIESVDLGSEFNNQMLLLSIAALLLITLFMLLYFDKDEKVRIVESILTFIAIVIVLYSSLRKILIAPDSMEIAVTISILLIIGMYVPVKATYDAIKTKRNPKEGEHLVPLYTLDIEAYKKTALQPWTSMMNIITANFKEDPLKALLLFTLPGGVVHSIIYSISIVLVHIPAMIFSRIIAFLFTSADLNTGKHTNNCVCPECGYRMKKPIYVCSQCGIDHDNIAPGKYGVHFCKCECGNNIPCTVKNKRWQYSEQKCPNCLSTIHTDESEPFAIIMVGATASGKTTLAINSANFFMNNIASSNNYSIDEDYSWKIIQNSQHTYNNHFSSLSEQINIYALKFDSNTDKNNFKTPKSLYYYDVDGSEYSTYGCRSSFNGMLNELEGIIFIINPYDVAEYSIKNGMNPNEDNDSNLIFSYFLSIYSNYTGTGPTEKINVPLAIILTRSEEVGIQSGLEIDHDTISSNPISQFLTDNGLYNLINEISLRFQKVRYFSLEASSYDKETSFAPIRWFIYLSNKKMIGKME